MGPQNDRRLLTPVFHIVGASCDREDYDCAVFQSVCNISVRTAPFCRRKKSRVIVKNVNTYMYVVHVAKSYLLAILKNRTENRRQINRTMSMTNITEGQVRTRL